MSWPDGYSGTMQTAFAALKRTFAFACRSRLYEGENPCVGVETPGSAKPRVGRALSRIEQERLLKAAQTHDAAHDQSFMAPLIRLLLGTGLRIGEAAALVYDSEEGLDLTRGCLTVTGSLCMDWDERRRSGMSLQVIGGRAKTASSLARVHFGPDTARALRDHRLATAGQDGDRVFQDPKTGGLVYSGRGVLPAA